MVHTLEFTNGNHLYISEQQHHTCYCHHILQVFYSLKFEMNQRLV